MELIHVRNDAYDEYESLLLERDEVNKQAEQAWVSYVQLFGELTSALFEEKVECIKRKKTIAFYQAAINRGGKVDQNALSTYLEREMASYYAQLKKMLEENRRCREAEEAPAYRAQRSKELYRRIAKLIHPDINPETDQNADLLDLWMRAVSAYTWNDVKSLAEIEVLVRKVLRELGQGEVNIDIPDLEKKIEELKEEIETTKSREPYTLIALLEDKEACAEKKRDLEEELEEYRHYNAELDEVIANMLKSGGLKLTWQISRETAGN